MSDIMISRKRRRRAVDPCLGFYVSSVHASNFDETASDLHAGPGPALTSVLEDHLNAVENGLCQIEPRPNATMLLAISDDLAQLEVPDRNGLSAPRHDVTSSLGCPKTPEPGQRLDKRLNVSRPSIHGEPSPMTVEDFLRLSAAATKNDRVLKMARYVSKRKRRYLASKHPVRKSEPVRHITGVCVNKQTLSTVNDCMPWTNSSLEIGEEDLIQLRSRNIRRTMLTSPVPDEDEDTEIADTDTDTDTAVPGQEFIDAHGKKRLPKRRRKTATKKKLNERLFEALVFTHGHPDESLIDLNDPDHPYRPPLYFVPLDSAAHEGRKRTTGAFVNPRRSLAIRSASVSFPTRHLESGAQMGSVLNRWPVNIVQQNKAEQERQNDQPKTQRGRSHPQNNRNASSFEFQSHDRQPLTFTNAVHAERSYTRMFLSTVVGPSKPKPENRLSSRGVIDLLPIESGAVLLKSRLSSKQESDKEGGISINSIDEPATLRMQKCCAGSLNRQNDTQGLSDSEFVGSNQHQHTSLNSALNNAVFNILSDNSSSGTGMRYVQSESPQTTRNTLQRGVNDNLSTNLYGGETAQVIDMLPKKPPVLLASFMEHCQQAIQRGSVAENQDELDGHRQPRCKGLDITRHCLLHISGARARPAGPSVELSPISGFSKASIERYKESSPDEIENEYPRMRSTLRFDE
ncbi:hypothetical protein BJ165DRAFT_1039625 [Panaeolus papilionaceus]|nr:hypothetical protein BJ165DRAFT_1039625 [Panaeolus papilionaceus]